MDIAQAEGWTAAYNPAPTGGGMKFRRIVLWGSNGGPPAGYVVNDETGKLVPAEALDRFVKYQPVLRR